MCLSALLTGCLVLDCLGTGGKEGGLGVMRLLLKVTLVIKAVMLTVWLFVKEIFDCLLAHLALD